MTTINGYKYRGLKRYRDNRGTVRYYLRATGHPLPDPAKGFRAFDQAYWAAIDREPQEPKPSPKLSRDGTIEKAVAAYINSDTFAALAPATRETRGFVLRAWAKGKIGGALVSTLRPEDIERGLENRRAQPPTANKWLVAVRMLLDYCIETKAFGITKNPTADVKRLALAKTGGYPPWTEEGVAAFDARWQGTTQYVAKELLLVLGQRRGDILRFGWRMVTPDNMIEFEQSKTGTSMRLPLPKSLLAVLPPRSNVVGMDGTEQPFLLTVTGKPFEARAFTKMMTAAWAEVGFACSTHGARKLGAQRLYRNALRKGHPQPLALTMAYTGHKTEKELRKYLGDNFEQQEYAAELAGFMMA